MQTASKLIDATVSSAGGTQRNDPLDVTVTISNRGKENTDVSVWVQARPNDPDSQNLLNWWERENATLSKVAKVKSEEKNQVKLQLRVPPQAKSIVYHYDIWISAHNYPELKFLRRPQQLQVLPTTDKDFKPKFSIVEPVMTRSKPYSIAPGESVEVIVQVENRSTQVERYQLQCDLPSDWHDLRYPNGGDGLLLNPSINNIGNIILVLTPPKHSRARVYSPTVRLSRIGRSASKNPHIDILYFQIPPVGNPQLQLEPVGDYPPGHQPTIPGVEIGRQTRQFRAQIDNQANSPRTINIEVDSPPRSPLEVRLKEDKQKSTTFDLEPWIHHQEAIEVKLRRWRRILRRKDRILPFEVRLTDPDPKAQEKELQTLQGEVVWQRTPWWVWLMLWLSLLGVAGYLALWLWKLLYVLPPVPKIETFQADRTDGSDILQSSIDLNFTVENPENLDSVMLTYLDAAGQRTSNRFDRQTIALPENLPTIDSPVLPGSNQTSDPSQKNYFQHQQCNLQKRDRNPGFWEKLGNIGKFLTFDRIENEQQLFQCQFRVANLPPANDYSFELQVFPKPDRTQLGIRKRDATQPTDTELTESVAVLPIPPLQIHNLKSDVITNPGNAREQIELTWDIHNINTLEKLNIVQTEAQGQSEIYTYSYQDGEFSPPENTQTELRCLPIEDTQLECTWKLNQRLSPSQYKYRIEVFSRQNPSEAADVRDTQNTLVFTPPQLDRFAAINRPYTGGEDPILFDLAIDNPRQVKALILRAIDSGIGQGRELQRYDFLSDGDNFLPPALQSCQLGTREKTPQLVCRNLPTQPLPIGQYQFELVAISRQEGGQPISLSSDAIVVRPPSAGGGAGSGAGSGGGGDVALSQIDFKINGQPVGENPTTFIFAFDPNGAPTILNLAWEIKGAENRNLQVSLSPLLATADAKGSLKFTLQSAPSQQTFTLQVTNELGEVETRTALVQTYPAASPAAPVPPPGDSGTPGISPSKLPPPPSDPDNLQPLEVPPTLD